MVCDAWSSSQSSFLHAVTSSRIGSTQNRSDTGGGNVLTDAYAEEYRTITNTAFDIGGSASACAMANGVFAIIDNIQ